VARFCAELDGTCGPYLLLNHSGRQMDAQVMAHEVGHGLHLARSLAAQSPLVGLPSFALIEIPSTFTELWLAQGLLEHETDPGRRLALQAGAVETAIGNVFETAVHAQAERGCYRLKAEGLTLSVERLNELWGEQFRAGFGDSVEGEEVISRWALMPHAVVYRFYLYNYSFSCLIALALMRCLRDDPERFASPLPGLPRPRRQRYAGRGAGSARHRPERPRPVGRGAGRDGANGGGRGRGRKPAPAMRSARRRRAAPSLPRRSRRRGAP
jgi:oligoendopeptidase F